MALILKARSASIVAWAAAIGVGAEARAAQEEAAKASDGSLALANIALDIFCGCDRVLSQSKTCMLIANA